MEVFVFGFDVVKYNNGFFHTWWFYQYLLETTVKCTILFYVHAVLIKCRCTYALQIATGKGRFKDIGSIKRTGCTTCTYNSMYLINEQDHVTVLFKLVHDRLHALFKLATVFGAGYKCCKVKADNTLIKQYS